MARSIRLRSVLFLATLALVGCSRTPMLYPAPPTRVPSPPPRTAHGSPIEEVAIDVDGVGRQIAWYVAGEADGPALVFLHGNGENLETLRLSGTLDAFVGLGLPAVFVDYPGYGACEGKPGEGSIVTAATAAADWLGAREARRPLVLVGWSLGAAAAFQVAERIDVAALVVMSPWTTLADIGREHFPGWMVALFARDRYDSLAVAERLELPVLVIHGERDEIIPVAHGRRVAEALADARWVPVPGFGHNDLLGAPRVWEALADFLGEV